MGHQRWEKEIKCLCGIVFVEIKSREEEIRKMSSYVLQPHTYTHRLATNTLFSYLWGFISVSHIQSFKNKRQYKNLSSKFLDYYLFLPSSRVQSFSPSYNMKRDSVSFDQSHAVDDEPNAKLRHQSLLKEYLELQKVFVSRKRKLQAEMQKRETILAEVRFLRRRHKYLLKTRASNMGKVPLHLPNSDIKSTAIEGERSQSALEASPENSGRVLVTNSHLEDEGGEGEQLVPEEEVKFAKKPKNYLIYDKGVGKRKIFWPDKVTLKHCRIP